MDTTATCQDCGKQFNGDNARNQLRGHRMQCAKRKNENEAKDMNETKTKKAPGNGDEAKPNINPNLTAEERQIVDRVANQDTSWMTITEGDMEDFSLMSDPMELPPPARKAQQERRYAFHWAELKPARIDQLTRMATPPLRWAIATRTTFPELSDYVNDNYGCVTRHDCALLFKPWAHHARVIEAKQRLTKAYEEGSGLTGGKNKIASRHSDVEVMTGPKHKIDGGDQVLADEAVFDGRGDVMGELVADEG
jgi:hypothetical protein